MIGGITDSHAMLFSLIECTASHSVGESFCLEKRICATEKLKRMRWKR